jgi:hypothetical protein
MRVKAKTWGVIGPINGSLRIAIYIRKNPNCRPYSSPHQVPKHKMLWYIEKGTLREVGKIDA